MVSAAATMLGLIAVVLAFWFPLAAWIPYAFPAAYLLVNLRSMRQHKAKASPDLSPPANALLARYPYWYEYPNVVKDSSRAAGFLAVLAIILGMIGYFRGSPWTLVPGIVPFVAMSVASRGFDPISRLSDEESRKAHDEIVSYLIHGAGDWRKSGLAVGNENYANIIEAYSLVMQQRQELVCPASDLPYPKEVIRSALLRALRDPVYRLGAPAVKQGLWLLESYVTEAEYDLVKPFLETLGASAGSAASRVLTQAPQDVRNAADDLFRAIDARQQAILAEADRVVDEPAR